MTEREKMLAGEIYDCGDTELLKQWHKAKNLIREYNQTGSECLEEKDRILCELLGARGKTSGLLRHSMQITGVIYPSAITARSI